MLNVKARERPSQTLSFLQRIICMVYPFESMGNNWKSLCICHRPTDVCTERGSVIVIFCVSAMYSAAVNLKGTLFRIFIGNQVLFELKTTVIHY